MSTKRIIVLSSILLFALFSSTAQVSLQTGSGNFSLPMFNWQDDKSRLNSIIALSYSSGSGLKVSDISSNVGQGWSMIAGGVISRMQNGEPDDQVERNGAEDDLTKYPSGILYATIPAANGYSTALTKYPIYGWKNQLYTQHNVVAEDKQLDYFSFQFNGKAGMFVLDPTNIGTAKSIGDTKLKITFQEDASLVNQGIRTKITSFSIQDVDGLIYKFSAKGLSKVLQTDFCDENFGNRKKQPKFKNDRVYYQTGYDVGPTAFPWVNSQMANPFVVSNWYLTEIEDALTHRKIYFNYDVTRNINNTAGEDIMINHNKKDYAIVSHKISIEKTPGLTSIVYPDGHNATFNYGAARVDLNGDSTLSSVDITYQGRYLSKYELNTTYFILNRYGTPIYAYQKRVARLCLRSVRKIGIDLKEDSPPYLFDYYTGSDGDDVVPPPFTFAKDIWGYYNGLNSKGYLGEDIALDTKINEINHYNKLKGLCYLRQANPGTIIVNPKDGYAKNGLLKQIIYPTGGTLTYEYEQNVGILNGASFNAGGVHVSKTSSTDGGISNGCTNPVITQYKYVNEDSTQSSLWGLELPENEMVSNTHYKPEYKTFKLRLAQFPTCEWKFQYPGIILQTQAISQTALRNQAILSTALTILGILGTVNDILLFAAGETGGLTLVLDMIVEVVEFAIACIGPQSKDTETTTYYNANLNAASPLPTQFKRVEVIENNGAIGKTVQEFTSEDDYPIWEPDNPAFSAKQRFAAWAYGLPKITSVFDVNRQLVKQTLNEYSFDDILSGGGHGQPIIYKAKNPLYIISAKNIVLRSSSQRNVIWSDPNEYNNTANYQQTSDPNMLVDIYDMYTGRVELKSTVEKAFKPNSADYLETVTSYDYNTSNYEVNRITTTQSDGNIRTKEIKYTIDYYDGILNTMKQNNIVSTPIAIVQSTGNGSILSEHVTEFTELTNGNIKPYRAIEQRFKEPLPLLVWDPNVGGWVNAFTPYQGPGNSSNSPGYIQTQQMTYDATGNLIGIIDEGNRSVSNLYGYSDKFIVASVINADPSVDSPAYTSFETESLGGWTLTGGSAVYIENSGITGTRSFDLSTRTLSKSLNNSKPYTLSFWANNISYVSVSTGATLVKSNPTYNGFTYYEYDIAPGTSSISISRNGIFSTPVIDELRLYPKAARMRSVSYDPLIGKTSECDENNRITYYEYDNLGRLRFVKDENKNVLKMYEYNNVSAAKQNGCPGIYYNHFIQEVFTKSNCNPEYTGSDVTFTVPANTYSSVISQFDADAQAENYILTNGQNYANSNGSCLLLYYNSVLSQDYTSESCGVGYTGGTVTYTVPAGRYTSLISQLDADTKALEDIEANGDAYSNSPDHRICTIDTNPEWEWPENGPSNCQMVDGVSHLFIQETNINPNSSSYGSTMWTDVGPNEACDTTTYCNSAIAQNFQRNNCPQNYTGGFVFVSVPAGTYCSVISQSDADQQAQVYAQDYANQNGECLPLITTCAPNQNVNLNSICKILVPDMVGSVVACGSCTVTQSPVAGTQISSSHNQTHIITFTATDTNSNTGSCTATLTAKDLTAPVITVCASSQNVNLDATCKITVPNLVPSVTATDNCSVTVTQSPVAGTLISSSHNQTHVVTLTATDGGGNTATCTATLTAKDVTVPVITVCASNQNVNLDGTCKITVPNLVPSVTATDNCGGTITITQSPVAGTQISSSHNQTHVVTLTATDGGGNTATCTATLTAKDVTNPVITVCAPNQNVNLSSLCKITVPNLVPSVTATDNCGGSVTITQSPVAGTVISSSHNQTHVVTLTATDAAGNAATCTATLTAKDVTVPVITVCASSQNVNLDATCKITVPNLVPSVTATDNCSVTVTQSPTAGTLISSSHNQTHVVTLTATDGGGNTATCTATLTAKDVTGPVITVCAPSQNVNLDATCKISIPNLVPSVTATDNCGGGVTITQSPVAGTLISSSHNQTHIVTLTATDAAGNTSSCTATLTAKDVTVPVITVCASSQNVNLSSLCKVTVPNLVPSVTATDNCGGGVTITQSPTAGTVISSSHNQTHVVTLTATDAAGNTATCTATLTAKDVTAPVITVCASSQNVNLSSLCKITVPNMVGSVIATDNCTVNITQSPVAGTVISSSHNQTHVVTFTATDGAGNTATCTATLTAKDVTAPVITTCASSQNVNLDATCKITVPNLVPSVTATDNCSVTVTQSPVAGTLISSSHNQTHVVTLTATDGAGNTATCTATLTAKDVTVPVITVCASNQNVNLDGTCKITVPNLVPSVTATDNCGGTITITQSPVAGTQISSSHNQTHVVTLTATDGGGNTATCTATLTAKDVTNPAITVCAPNQNVNLSSLCKITVPNLVPSVTATDNCGGSVTITQSPVAGTVISSSHNQTHVVTLTATDAAGNTATCTATLTAKDVTVPVITVCASSQNVNLDATCKIAVPNLVPSVTATDNCSVSVTQSPTAGTLISSSHNQTHVVTLTAADGGGNTATCTATLTAKDVTGPVITVCASSQNVNLDATCKISIPNLVPSVTATDNCGGGVTITQSPVAGTLISSSHNQTHIVTLTATDAAGNTSSCTATLTAKDVTVPVITVCASSQNVNLSSLCKVTVPNLVPSVTATDNCGGGVTITQSPTAGTVISSSHNQTHVVTLTATDAAGNTATCTATLTAKDVTAPVITVCASSQNVNLSSLCKITVPNMVGSVIATDNCTVNITQSPVAGTVISSSHNQTHVVTFTATDGAGNTATCTATLTAKDVTAPVITTCASSQNVNLDATCKITVPNLVPSVTATDNCSVTVTQSPVAGTLISSSHNQTHVVTLTATDGAGNTATCTATLTAKDVTVPVITVCASNQNVNLDGTCKITVPNLVPSVTATDNCGGTITITQSPVAGTQISSSHNQTHVVTLTATDGGGNTATCTATLTAKDITNPAITVCAPNQNVNLSSLCKITIPNLVPSVTATDNCGGGVTITQSPTAGTVISSSHNQTHVVTLTATDAAGNTATCTATLTAKDVTAPVITTCPSNQNVTLDANSHITIPDFTESLISSDNCGGVVTQSPAAGTVLSSSPNQIHNITLTVTDAAGNTASCSTTVTAIGNNNLTIYGVNNTSVYYYLVLHNNATGNVTYFYVNPNNVSEYVVGSVAPGTYQVDIYPVSYNGYATIWFTDYGYYYGDSQATFYNIEINEDVYMGIYQ